MSQLPAAGADIEQIAGLPEALTDQRRHARDIVGAVDPRGVEFDGINRLRRRGVLRRARRNPRPRSICVTTKGNGHDDTRGNNSSPRTAAAGLSPLCGLVPPVRQHQDTPPAAPARDFPVAGLLAHGSSPPTTFPRTRAVLSGSFWSKARRLQLRGQPRHCASARTAFPFDPLREPPRSSWRGRMVASTSVADASAGLSMLWSIGHSRVRYNATGCAAMNRAPCTPICFALGETGARNITPAGLRAPRRAR
jgi:hypothetical protein